ncbi:hypothetical protein VWY99_21475 [Xanthomonas citri pv. citri]
MIDVQVGNRRERLSTGTRDRHLAEKKEQNIIDALRDDPAVTSLELKRILRGERLAAIQERRHEAKSWSLKEACDACLRDRGEGGWGTTLSNETYKVNCGQAQKYLTADVPVAFVDQEKIEDYADFLINDEENAKATVNRKLFALMHVLAYAKAHKQYPGDLPRWKPYKEGDNARQFVLTAQDERAIFDAIAKLDEREDGPKGATPSYEMLQTTWTISPFSQTSVVVPARRSKFAGGTSTGSYSLEWLVLSSGAKGNRREDESERFHARIVFCRSSNAAKQTIRTGLSQGYDASEQLSSGI